MQNRPTHRLPLLRLIQENFSVVTSYAFSDGPITKWMQQRLHGGSDTLYDICIGMARSRAERALLEFATQLRLLDNIEKLSDYFREVGSDRTFGTVTQADGTETALRLRDLTNKIIHSSSFQWKLSDDGPIVVCLSDNPKRWVKAEISITRLGFLCAGFHSTYGH
jgi:hypothetical protein